jgi:hypothetical protein
MEIKTKKDLLSLIKGNDRYTWPGGYPVYISQASLGILCWDCVQNHRSVRLELVESFKSNPPYIEPLFEGEWYCDCGKQLEVAYPED